MVMGSCVPSVASGLWPSEWLLIGLRLEILICALDTNLSLTFHFSLFPSNGGSEFFTFHYSLFPSNALDRSFGCFLTPLRRHFFGCCEASEAVVGGIRMTRPRHCDEWLCYVCDSWF